ILHPLTLRQEELERALRSGEESEKEKPKGIRQELEKNIQVDLNKMEKYEEIEGLSYYGRVSFWNTKDENDDGTNKNNDN
ncbi:3276_t:CDS:2, partial [Racocetra fulgida]